MKKILSLILISISTCTFAQSIYEIQGQAASSPYNTQEITTRGIVTAAFSTGYFIQDGDSAWCGLYVYDDTQTPAIGDSIELTGTIEEYYDLTELKTITEYKVLSSGNDLPEPIVITTGEAQEKWESVLVRVEDASCTNTDLGFGEWEVNDGSGALAVDDFGIAYTPILDVSYSISGPLNYSFSAYKLEPRNQDDIELNIALYFSKEPVATNINTTAFDLLMETNVESRAFVEYGLTPAFEIEKVFSSASSTTHALAIDNLEAGTIYHAKSYAVSNANDTTPIFTGVYATQSESSGEIKTYFNHPEMAYALKGGFTENIIDTIKYYIAKAQTSLDVTMYDLTNHAPQSDSSNYELIQAINDAYRQGVFVRFITDDVPTNSALDSLHPEIPLVRGNADGIMHNKFLIIDAESTENAWVVTGSLNWTYNNLFMDFNNMVCIQDESLAKAYQIEFNEMWGSTSNTPNAANAKFGKDKKDNTPHQFNIGETQVELYFSPSDKTTSKIVQAIDSSDNTLDFALMVFTENQLGTAIVNAKKRGVQANGYIDYVESSGSDFDYLKENGVNVIDFVNESNESWPTDKTLHHKFCIIDLSWGTTPLLITGTHNWSASAESRNDENTLFIYNGNVANSFYEEFVQIEMHINGGGESVSNNNSTNLKVFPNPSNGKVYISLTNNKAIERVNIYSVDGQKTQSYSVGNDNKAEINIYQSGLFFIEVINDGSRVVQKIIVQ